MMDLVTLVTLCSLSVDPKLMHALIWHQSGGEPWSFTVPGEREPRVYRKPREAVREANALHTDDPIRVGLTGLPIRPSDVTETTFLPCPNIAAAAHEIEQLTARCAANPASKADATFCAVAAYHGSWERPDLKFADAVRHSVAKNDAPDFDMPKETGIEVRDALLDMPPAAQTHPPSRPEHLSEENERAWSSALFPTKEERSEDTSDAPSSGVPSAKKRQSQRQQNAQRPVTSLPNNGLFVRRSSASKP
ncbi:MAG: hypothetical protein R3D62_04240 [Xanthobacteraceae bacterium]